MRIIFMGTPEFSVGTLSALLDAGHEICLVVTQPDRPKGRGKETQFSPVKQVALDRNLTVFQPEKVRDPECVDSLRSCQADAIVVVAFGQILPKTVLDLTPYGCINVHASLLPKYRGAAPIQWAILQGEKVTGVTIMQMDEGLDTGDILLQREVEIKPDETGDSLQEKLSAAGADLAVETLWELEQGSLTHKKQGETPTPYASMLKKEMGDIDWTKSAEEIDRLIRALNSWPSAFTFWQGKTLKIWKARPIPEEKDGKTRTPGQVTSVSNEGIEVQTGDGRLRIEEVQMEGKKRMAADAFLRGNPMEAGTQFVRNL